MLTWHEDNLEAHAAKHFLGAPEEEWEQLVTEPETVRAWRAEARAALCNPTAHPVACPQTATCGAAAALAAAPYARLADAEWAFSSREGLHVDYVTGDGVRERCATGPRGIVIAAVMGAEPAATAKTAFRQGAARYGHVRWGVRKLHALASTGHGGLSRRQLLELEALLLLPTAPVTDPHVRAIWMALRTDCPKVNP